MSIMKNFNDYKFRCSALGHLMTQPRSKKDREAGVLSKTTQTYLKDMWIKEVYGREEINENKFTLKGNFVEEDSITLLSKNSDRLIMKNEKSYENDFIKGTPDIVDTNAGKVIDIKTKWDMRTFMQEDGNNKMYYWQIIGYMWLTGMEKAEIVYTLVNAPEFLIEREFKKHLWIMPIDDGSEEMVQLEEQVWKNLTFDDVDPKLRMKVYTHEYEPETIEILKNQIKKARNYLNNLSLN